MRTEAAATLTRVARWAAGRDDVVAVVLVGSHARGTEAPGSDVDLVVVAVDADVLLTDDDWLDVVTPGATGIRRQRWGVVVERRMALPSGLVVELDVAPASWLASPLDPGTAAVLSAGARPVWDPSGAAATAIADAGGRAGQ